MHRKEQGAKRGTRGLWLHPRSLTPQSDGGVGPPNHFGEFSMCGSETFLSVSEKPCPHVSQAKNRQKLPALGQAPPGSPSIKWEAESGSSSGIHPNIRVPFRGSGPRDWEWRTTCMCHQISETSVTPDTDRSSEVCWEKDWESQAMSCPCNL